LRRRKDTPNPGRDEPRIDARIRSIQPGGGTIMRLELAWGYVRRWYLWMFRRGYVERMQRLRKGTENRCPHPVFDPRDLKFFRNQGGYSWDRRDDPFAWRDNLPFARAGLAELLVFSVLLFGMAVVVAWIGVSHHVTGGWAAGFITITTALTVMGLLVVWFFRNPRRRIPDEPGVVVSPADGKVVEIEEIPHDEFIGGPALKIGIFLSIFNVHINRVPVACRVVGLTYRPGKFLNAMRPESARENEQLGIQLEQTGPVTRHLIVRQITGAIARRIVCWLKPGDELSIGEQLGMIKLGSRTELVLPREGFTLATRVGEHVKAGSSVVGRYSA
jgi:phosphatidylserine decarboxylase